MESQSLSTQIAEQSSEPPKGRLEAAALRAVAFSIPQWLSAVSSLVVACIAIWALLFSSTSEALVKYLHSELATRNIQIATLEARDQKLQDSVERRERELNLIEQKTASLQDELNSLTSQRDELQKQVSEIQSERARLLSQIDQIGSKLSKTEFSLVKEKINVELSKKLVSVLPFNLIRDERSGKAEVWSDYLKFIRAFVETLPEKDHPLGRQAADKFASQCSHLSKVTFDLSLPKRVPRDDKYFDRYFSMNAQDRAKLEAEYKERDKDRAQKTDALVKQIFAAEDDIKRCLLSVT